MGLIGLPFEIFAPLLEGKPRDITAAHDTAEPPFSTPVAGTTVVVVAAAVAAVAVIADASNSAEDGRGTVAAGTGAVTEVGVISFRLLRTAAAAAVAAVVKATAGDLLVAAATTDAAVAEVVDPEPRPAATAANDRGCGCSRDCDATAAAAAAAAGVAVGAGKGRDWTDSADGSVNGVEDVGAVLGNAAAVVVVVACEAVTNGLALLDTATSVGVTGTPAGAGAGPATTAAENDDDATSVTEAG